MNSEITWYEAQEPTDPEGQLRVMAGSFARLVTATDAAAGRTGPSLDVADARSCILAVHDTEVGYLELQVIAESVGQALSYLARSPQPGGQLTPALAVTIWEPEHTRGGLTRFFR